MMWLRQWIRLLVLLCALLPVCVYAGSWQRLAEGLHYRRLVSPKWGSNSQLHAFRIDLQHYRLALALAEDYQKNMSVARELAQRQQALIAVNGGFFTPRQKPLGLRIQQGVVRYPLKNTSWWGIFYLMQRQAHIVALGEFKLHPDIDMAVQAGPRLLIHGKIPSLKAGFAERSVLGIDRKGRVILLSTENAPMQTRQLAILLRDVFACQEAINLDGGTSAQLYAQVPPSLAIDIGNLSLITDAVLVLQR